MAALSLRHLPRALAATAAVVLYEEPLGLPPLCPGGLYDVFEDVVKEVDNDRRVELC